jgi:hypothetical protein
VVVTASRLLNADAAAVREARDAWVGELHAVMAMGRARLRARARAGVSTGIGVHLLVD